MSNLPTVHYSNGSFLVFRAEDAKLLRRRRILSQTLASGAPTLSQAPGPPYCISHHAAYVIVSHGLAHFVQLVAKPASDISLEDNRARFASKLLSLADHEKDMFIARRMAELRRHKVPINEKNLGQFKESKMLMTIVNTPDKDGLASYEEQVMNSMQIMTAIHEHHWSPDSQLGVCVYHDLYERGFFISSGMKFGSDFLAYMGDPVRYHAQYAVRVVDSDDQGRVDLDKTEFSQLNCLQRLTHTANKIPLFATCDNSPIRRVRYWTLKERIYLNSNSSNNDLESVEPRVESASYEQIKIRRTC